MDLYTHKQQINMFIILIHHLKVNSRGKGSRAGTVSTENFFTQAGFHLRSEPETTDNDSRKSRLIAERVDRHCDSIKSRQTAERVDLVNVANMKWMGLPAWCKNTLTTPNFALKVDMAKGQCVDHKRPISLKKYLSVAFFFFFFTLEILPPM